MPDAEFSSPDAPVAPEAAAPTRKRPKPGERRVQILQALATMMEQPGAGGRGLRVGLSFPSPEKP